MVFVMFENVSLGWHHRFLRDQTDWNHPIAWQISVRIWMYENFPIVYEISWADFTQPDQTWCPAWGGGRGCCSRPQCWSPPWQSPQTELRQPATANSNTWNQFENSLLDKLKIQVMFNIEHLHVELLLLFVVDSAPWFRRDSHLINGGPEVKSWKHLQYSKHHNVYIAWAMNIMHVGMSYQSKINAQHLLSPLPVLQGFPPNLRQGRFPSS